MGPQGSGINRGMNQIQKRFMPSHLTEINMSDTIRIYNRLHIRKAQRPRWVNQETPLKTILPDGSPGEPLYVLDPGRSSFTGLPYQPYGQICMGHCKNCRDPGKDQRRQRKIRKEDLNRELVQEFKSEENP